MRHLTPGIIGAALVAASALSIGAIALPRTSLIAEIAAPQSQEVETFTIDPAHSSVIFKVKHMGVSVIYGRFNDLSGEIVWNQDDPTQHAIKAEVKASSIDTNSSSRDNHLKSPDFFDVANFPTITFANTAAKASGTDKYEVEGTLTLHGVTKPITVMIDKTGYANVPRMGKRLGLACEFTIKRSDYGMTYGVDGAVSDEVTIMLGFEGGIKK